MVDSHNFDLNVDHYGAEQCDKGIRSTIVIICPAFYYKGKGRVLVDEQFIYQQVICLFCQGCFHFYQADDI